ncbi:MAG: carbon-nitrogen hydrolase family protein [Candidatus Saccharibacteria bacterium]
MSRFIVGLCQMRVDLNKEVNLKMASEMVREAAAQGCDLVVLPEMFNCPYQTARFPEYAESIPGGESYAMLQELARSLQIILIGGSIPEIDKDGRVFNTSLAFNESGQMLACHRKMHLFNVDIQGGISFRESDTLSAGQEVTTFESGLGPMGMAICYDLRFPELSRLMVQRGAQILLFPGAFNTTTGPLHWEILLRCRAVDNQVYVIAASPAYDPAGVYPAHGHSMVVDPWGKIVAEAETSEELVLAEINLENVKRVRDELPLLKHRRLDLYELREKP